MLHLQAQTDPGWIDRAQAHMDEILLDHAHCEKKAASTAINMIFRYPDKTSLMLPLSRLAQEELQHFEQVLLLLEKRGLVYARQRPSPYAGKLMKALREREPARLLDTLLCCAYIEARSCERMKILANGLQDKELAELYQGLLVSEARHHQMYVDLALGLFEQDEVRTRLQEIGAHEAAVIKDAPLEPRLHNA